jgi:hypothetical protein
MSRGHRTCGSQEQRVSGLLWALRPKRRKIAATIWQSRPFSLRENHPSRPLACSTLFATSADPRQGSGKPRRYYAARRVTIAEVAGSFFVRLGSRPPQLRRSRYPRWDSRCQRKSRRSGHRWLASRTGQVSHQRPVKVRASASHTASRIVEVALRKGVGGSQGRTWTVIAKHERTPLLL